jgi:hypothetical protein
VSDGLEVEVFDYMLKHAGRNQWKHPDATSEVGTDGSSYILQWKQNLRVSDFCVWLYCISGWEFKFARQSEQRIFELDD